MTRSRWWITGGVLAAILVLLLGWFLLVSPTREQAVQLTTQARDLDQQNALLRSRIAQLQAQAAELPQKQAELDLLVRQAPPTPAIPDFVRQLSALADQTGVNLVSLTPAPPVPLAVPTPTATASAPDPTATGSPTPAASAPPPQSTMEEIGLAVVATGEFANLQLFVGRLETLERLVLTTAFTMNRGAEEAVGANPLTLSLTGKIFVLPGLPTVLPTPTPSAGSPSAQATSVAPSSPATLPTGT